MITSSIIDFDANFGGVLEKPFCVLEGGIEIRREFLVCCQNRSIKFGTIRYVRNSVAIADCGSCI
jgi:hypothetical protein